MASLLAALGFLVLGGILYFAPTIAAKHKPHVLGVFLLNLLLGWTVVGWVAAFIWAFTGRDTSAYLCPHCREAVDRLATICPHCQTPMTPLSRIG